MTKKNESKDKQNTRIVRLTWEIGQTHSPRVVLRRTQEFHSEISIRTMELALRRNQVQSSNVWLMFIDKLNLWCQEFD